jgi:hypothetical protein
MGRPAEALIAIEKAMRLDPRNSHLYLFEQGFAYTFLGRYEEAIPALEVRCLMIAIFGLMFGWLVTILNWATIVMRVQRQRKSNS